ncbi:MAG: SDR family oxidoreductase [Candidatus Eremiobacteraeota bacterium]|nr:SDR family oxidoreductase [Candidatus Eremiobacteraeota bacterium]
MHAAEAPATTDLFDLSGKVAVITGSTRGIGRAIAEQFARRGAKVVISSRKADACEAVREGIEQAGGTAIAVPCNISAKEQLAALVETTVATWGAIDILVCNAAVNPYFGPTLGIPDDAYDKIMNSNVRSNVWLCNMALPHIASAGGGAVIIVSSIAGIKGTRMLGTYGLSKAADSALARNLAVEWGPKNVRVNALAPGVIKTDFAKALYEDPATEKHVTKQYPIGRLGDVDDVSGVAVMLASRAGSFITGQTIVIDGGTTIGGFE